MITTQRRLPGTSPLHSHCTVLCFQFLRFAAYTSIALASVATSIAVCFNGKDNTYLIFVISVTQAGCLNPFILHPNILKNTQKLKQIAPKIVKYVVFRFQSGKFYTGQNFFTRAPPVVPVTNMRYD